MAEISAELDALSVSLIDSALAMLEEQNSLPVMLAVDCEEEIATFEDDTPDGCYRAACEYVAKLKDQCQRYALLYDGFVQDDEEDASMPALLFEFAERGMEHAWSGYMLWQRAQDGGIEVTDPLPGGAEELLFG